MQLHTDSRSSAGAGRTGFQEWVGRHTVVKSPTYKTQCPSGSVHVGMAWLGLGSRVKDERTHWHGAVAHGASMCVDGGGGASSHSTLASSRPERASLNPVPAPLSLSCRPRSGPRGPCPPPRPPRHAMRRPVEHRQYKRQQEQVIGPQRLVRLHHVPYRSGRPVGPHLRLVALPGQ